MKQSTNTTQDITLSHHPAQLSPQLHILLVTALYGLHQAYQQLRLTMLSFAVM